MTNTIVKTPLDRILAVIKREGKATLSDIRRSIGEFNQAGGAEKLRNIISDLVSKSTLIVHTNKSGNGQSVESYSIASDNASIAGNDRNGNISSNNARNDSNDRNSNIGSNNAVNESNEGILKITGTFDITLEGWQEILDLLSSLTNSDGNDVNDSPASTHQTRGGDPYIDQTIYPFELEPCFDEPVYADYDEREQTDDKDSFSNIFPDGIPF